MPDLGTNTLTADEEIAQRSGFNAGNVMSVLGAGLLGAAGPAGIAAASRATGREAGIRENIRQRERDNQQLQKQAQIKSWEKLVEMAGQPGFTESVAALPPAQADEVSRSVESALEGLGMSPNTPLGSSVESDKLPTKASIAYAAAQGDETAREAFRLLSPEERKNSGDIINARSLDPDAPDVWLIQNPDGGLKTLSTGAGGAVKTDWSQQENADGTISVIRQVGNSPPEVVSLLTDPEGNPIKTGTSARSAATREGADASRAAVQQRHDTREERLGANLFLSRERLANTIKNQVRTSEGALRDDFEVRVKPFREQLRQLDTLDSLLSGDVSALDEAQIVNQLSILSDSNVRAQANLNTFKNPGDLGQRLGGAISRFFAGTRTPSQLEEVRQLSTQLRQDIFDPAIEELSGAYKDVATRGKLDPNNVVISGKKSLSDMTMEELEAEKQRLLNGGG